MAAKDFTLPASTFSSPFVSTSDLVGFGSSFFAPNTAGVYNFPTGFKGAFWAGACFDPPNIAAKDATSFFYSIA